MSLKSLFVVLLVAVLLFGVVGVANAQESKGNSAQAQNGMPSVAEVVEISNQVVERNENQNGVPQGNAVQQQQQTGPCGPACRRQQIEPTEPVTPTIPIPVQPPTVITTTVYVTVTVVVTVEIPVETPCTVEVIEYNEASCPDYAPEKAPVYTCGTYAFPQPEAEEAASLPWWLIVALVMSIPTLGLAFYKTGQKNNA